MAMYLLSARRIINLPHERTQLHNSGHHLASDFGEIEARRQRMHQQIFAGIMIFLTLLVVVLQSSFWWYSQGGVDPMEQARQRMAWEWETKQHTRLREQWERETKLKQQEREQWEWEMNQQREKWEDEAINHRIEREKWERERQEYEREREQWDREHDGEARQREEERRRAGTFWEGPYREPHCSGFDTRIYAGFLRNLPDGQSWTQACQEMPIMINSRPVTKPHKCEGCIRSLGVQRMTARLVGLNDGDGWRAMCGSTPARIFGRPSKVPDYCEDSPGGMTGIWEFENLSCR
ncbi:hypothetical protein A0H81_03929 [Grifola frondosa]|uniref:Uncharacterized protein n=1 Tax=Grifola frondosa TaxID=5627 RepID=A0A1C7MGV0_GRIFR|nr:hypothetical protein A0H81_03929 [Grifola frondosa]